MTDITILQIDDRGSYYQDKHYPDWIFLATVLRWSVTGEIVTEDTLRAADVIVRQNDGALDSIAAFLADHIESGQIPIFNSHARIPLGSVEKGAVINKLRGLDGGFVGGLVDEAGLNYYVGGYQLFQLVRNEAFPVDDPFEKGSVWHRLMWDAPDKWASPLPSIVHSEEKVEPPELEVATSQKNSASTQNIESDDKGKSMRRTRLYEEIEMIENFEQMTGAKIRAYLHDVAGTAKSCVTEVKPALIKWIDGNGGVQETSQSAFGKWLQRHPRRNARRT